MPRIEKRLPIINKLGLHARAAIKLVQLTASYQATIMVSNGEKEASADSVMGLLMVEAAQGQSIHVTCEGEDAEAVMAAVEQLVAARFDEME
ncbi:MAG: HPr family phosphocarrier protein [Aeromonadaceae bacterium]